MTKGLFQTLAVYHDSIPHSAALNMAIDEALLDVAHVPSIRFYRWDHPALSFGYFGKFADVAGHAVERDLVRRWTGGGIVFHGEDLTYSIVIPASEPVFARSSRWIYEAVHRALCDALIVGGKRAELAMVGTPCCGVQTAQRAVPTDFPDRHSYCFANPVPADVLLNGSKIAGAAQRRNRLGLLQQGSIQWNESAEDLAARFARALSPKCEVELIGRDILEPANKIAAEKYGTESWLRRR